jgi:phospholipase/carboxylesterase
VNNTSILSEPSFCPTSNPKKLIFLLHGYGDNAKNFIQLANTLHEFDWQVNYIALEAPSIIPNFPSGRQWFDIYPKGKYISEAGPEEINIIRSEVLNAVKYIKNRIIKIKDQFALDFSDCFVVGFSQGGIMTFEFGHYINKKLAGLAIMSGRIMEDQDISSFNFLQTPLFISHGDKDDVLHIKNFYKSCEFLKKNKFNFEENLLKDDSHTISSEAIDLLQKFIKKNL